MEEKLIFKDLSYKLRGVMCAVHNELGRYRSERQYCDLIAIKLGEMNIRFQREKILEPTHLKERRGGNRVDFLAEDKIIIEVKHVPSFTPDIYAQCRRYLASSNKQLLLLVNFYYPSTIIKRVLNPSYKESVAPHYPHIR